MESIFGLVGEIEKMGSLIFSIKYNRIIIWKDVLLNICFLLKFK